KAGMGMDVDIARVPRREPAMTPVEVMTSESQERMLAIVRPGDLDEVLSLCRRWEIRASVVGRVTGTGRFRVYDGLFGDSDDDPPGPSDSGDTPGPGDSGDTPGPGAGDPSAAELLADVPVGSLGEGPDYDRPLARPADQDDRLAADPWPKLFGRFPPGADLGPELLGLLGSPGVGDSSWVWRQYDHQLFLNTVAGPGADAAVLRLKDTAKALALTTDGKARFCRLDPRVGGALAVLEAARNVACTGARPLALVNCLNFGNPEHPEVMWQFSEVVDGMAEACRELEIPVVGGNVSFYNESGGADIDPTPVVGVVGLIDELSGPVPGARLAPGERIVLLGTTAPELGGSEWAARHGLADGPPPAADLEAAFRLHPLVAQLVADRVVAGVHDCSDGGLAVALAEMAIAGGCGFAATCAGDLEALPPAAVCFAESANRVIVSVVPDEVAEVLARARAAGVPGAELGVAGGDRLVFEGCFDVGLDEAASAWRNALPEALSAELQLLE
ncbi:MAG: AIR synthase-related protein, partial [Acidimicrobiia bacterium]